MLAASGSPPQVRGKPSADVCRYTDSWITPAGAGKTNRAYQQAQQMGDHPRRCGENLDVARHFENGAGSPPQVRGKPAVYHQKRPVFGITPAGAGKTCYALLDFRHAWDHPRRCGENNFTLMFKLNILGSPPQVRGKLTMRTSGDDFTRITPAGAGKTTSSISNSSGISDHPRRCGENSATSYST